MLPKPSGPLVLTLALDNPSQSTLNALRKRYFPPHRNFLGAHITLFHAIPPHRLTELDQRLHELCAQQKPFDVFFGEPSRMGKGGVMLKIRERPSCSIESIHRRLLRELRSEKEEDALTNQDMMKLAHPHVTVLNKAEEEGQVDQCMEEMQERFGDGSQIKASGEGLHLWEYQGGPWKSLKTYSFKG